MIFWMRDYLLDKDFAPICHIHFYSNMDFSCICRPISWRIADIDTLTDGSSNACPARPGSLDTDGCGSNRIGFVAMSSCSLSTHQIAPCPNHQHHPLPCASSRPSP